MRPKGGGNRLILPMARTFLWLGWLMGIYRELFAHQIEDFSSTRSSIIDPPIVLLNLSTDQTSRSFLLFWLGSATDHRSHTPITTLFQYPESRYTNWNLFHILEACPMFPTCDIGSMVQVHLLRGDVITHGG